MEQEIKNIIFDLGGVLVDLDTRRCVDAFRAIGFGQAGDMVSQWHPSGILQEMERGTVGFGELCDFIREKSGAPVDNQTIADACYAIIGSVPDYKLEMLLELRKRFRVMMLSNTNEVVFPRIASEQFTRGGLTLDDYFERVFLSYRMHLLKPDAAIFEAVIQQAGILPGQTLFIDDSPLNVEAARALGFRTYQAAPKEDFRAIFDNL